MAGRQWVEKYEGDDPEKERLTFEKLAQDILRVQVKTRKRSRAAAIQRTFHAKSILSVNSAILRFNDDLADDLCIGFAQRGKSYPVTVRFSNAQGTAQPDHSQDMRGVALRVNVSEVEKHEIVSHGVV